MSHTPTPERIRAKYEWHTRVQTVDVGPDYLLTPTAQLRMQQEAGELHFSEGGLGFKSIASFGMAFLALQNNCVIYRRPAAGEPITVSTWSHSVKGAKFYRCYRFTDEAGEVLIDSMAVFALVDVNSHRLLRPSEFPFEIKHHDEFPHTCTTAPRLKPCVDGDTIGTYTVRFSQLDFNSHLNNTRYADIAFDHLPEDTIAKLKGFSIAFVHEARLHDTLELTLTHSEDGTRQITAQNKETTCFIAQIRI